MIIEKLPLKITANIFRLLFLLALTISCSQYKKNKLHEDVSDERIEAGETLALQHCQSCHMLPDPLWADSKTWEKGILPNMGPRLGMFYHYGTTYPSRRSDFNVSRNFYPSTSLVNDDQWQNIIDYYTSLSPDSLLNAQIRSRSINKNLSLFSAVVPTFHYQDPAISFIKIDTSGKTIHLIVADAVQRSLFRFNSNLQLIDSIQHFASVVNMEINNDQWFICNIGVLNPNTGRFGSGEILKTDKNNQLQKDKKTVLQGLRRPVQLTTADVNNDGKPDIILCEFGYLEGSLSWMENLGNDKYERHVLRALPGAIKAYVDDYNHDGLPDIWVLFAQGEEGVFLYTNKGRGQFSEQQVLRFPPIYGSSSFELADFNKDGFPDIVYTCGDNADYSLILKPYHGVYIFLNDGKNHFKQQYFFPINGCYKALARDFDGDGDLDIATISFFADYQKQPEEGFVYLENKGNYNFIPYSIPQTQTGRWLTMDAGDFDGDGKTDIVLGNFSVAPGLIKSKTDWKKGPPFLLLKNTGK